MFRYKIIVYTKDIDRLESISYYIKHEKIRNGELIGYIIIVYSLETFWNIVEMLNMEKLKHTITESFEEL